MFKRKMETFSWSPLSSCACMFIFTIIRLSSMIHTSEGQATTDPEEVRALNIIFTKWRLSVITESRNIKDDPCSTGSAWDQFINCDCSYNGTLCHITEMDLFQSHLRGEIPKELQSLTELRTLELSKNELAGPFPSFIANLTQLNSLHIGQNLLFGRIPKELGNLKNLVNLDLSQNALNGTIPKELGNLQNLIKLDLSFNSLSGTIPKEIGNIQNLKILDLSSNNFSDSLPSQVGNLYNLKILNLDGNSLTGRLPLSIGNLKHMMYLRLQGNAFQGPIPSSFSRLTSLYVLQIGELSNVSSSLEFIKNMTSIITLILRNCMIKGTLPSDVEYFRQLKHLDLSFNNISGSIPQSLFNLIPLENLFLGNNSLSGALPFSKGPKLKVIDLSYNSFFGSLPSWATETDNLELNLVANNFTEDDLKRSPKYTGLHCIQRDFSCNRISPKYSSFAVNSGGPTIKLQKNIEFVEDEKDLGAASFYIATSTRWAISSVGMYLDGRNSKSIINSSLDNCFMIDKNISLTSKALLKDVRVSPGSIRYYGLGLKNGNYSVNLQFAELNYVAENNLQNLHNRVFDIYIQRILIERDFDVKKASGGLSMGVTKDYEKIQVTKNFLEIHLFWAGKGMWGMYGPAIAAVRVVLEPAPNRRNLGVIIGIPVSCGLIIILLIFIALILRRKMYLNYDEELQGITLRTHTFSYAELKTATNGFDTKNKLGEGGFGPVYKGVLSDGRMVAVKQLSLRSHQGKIQFLTEIDTISAIQHRNLVKLYGCCIEGLNRLLVYEYLENKSLDQALFGKNDLDLSWKTRFEICVGTGRGLAYLHEESHPKIVHRDVKTSNILLDAELKPKLSDFGLAKLYDDNNTHLSTRVAGTIGYLAPEYAMKGHLTEKADVFGFGVSLLEVLSGRSNFASNLSVEQVYLLEWAWLLYENNRQMELIDLRLTDFNKEEAIRVFTVGLLCTQLSPILRPSMSRVVSMLLGDVELTTILSKPDYLNDLNMVGFEGSSTSTSHPSTTFK